MVNYNHIREVTHDDGRGNGLPKGFYQTSATNDDDGDDDNRDNTYNAKDFQFRSKTDHFLRELSRLPWPQYSMLHILWTSKWCDAISALADEINHTMF